MKHFFQNLLHAMGYEVHRYPTSFDPIMEPEFRALFYKLTGYHAQSKERLYALFKALKYIVQQKIEGDIVECGVYKGATPLMAGLTLQGMQVKNRKIYLYDTFEGMPEGTERDVESSSGTPARELLKKMRFKNWKEWCNASLDEVRKTISQSGYPLEQFLFVKGKVEDTIPTTMPEKIALLRLDTDWYESTYHELIHLYPKLVQNGILILDDYGHWKGAKDAVDRYFSETGRRIFLQRIDYTGYIGVKTESK